MRRAFALKKGDFLIAGIVLLAAVCGLAFLSRNSGQSASGLTAEIYIGGKLAETAALGDGERQLSLECGGGTNLVLISPEGVCMLEADCPNQDCVRAGLINRSGDVLACLPHGLLIRLSGGGGDLDAVAR